jgi:hypothetical protein
LRILVQQHRYLSLLLSIVRKGAVLWASLLAIASACEPLKPEDDHTRADCAHLEPPPPPNVTAHGGTNDGGTYDGGELDLVLPMHSVWYGTGSVDDAGNPRYESIGFDLDNTCTGEGEGPSCAEPLWATGPHHDGFEGIDNAIAQVQWQPGTQDSDTQTANGVNIVLRVRGYSGETDDDQVEVSVYYSPGLSPREDGGLDPLWGGQDRWAVVPGSLQPAGPGSTPSVDRPRHLDAHAYVSDGVLVARLEEALYPALFTGAPVPSRDVVIAAALRRGANGLWQLQNGTYAFRLELKRVLYDLAWEPLGPGGAYQLCQFPDNYVSQARGYCAFADIAFDNNSPTAPCDALSWAFGFDAIQARLGDPMEFSPPPLTCDPTVHPEAASCESVWAK